MTKKTMANKLTMTIVLVLALAISGYAAPVFDAVTFTGNLPLGDTQTISAGISSNKTLLPVKIEISGTNYTMSLNTSSYQYSWAPSSAGTVNFRIYAQDNESNTTTYNGSFSVFDPAPPAITIISPIGVVNTENLWLEIATSENSECKYSTSNTTYSQMGNFFASTGATSHTSLLVHLPGGQKEYYVACKDEDGNTGYGTIIFNINLPPAAQIILSEKPPLKADTYDITLITSKPLAAVPELQYKYDDENAYHEISLTGSDDYWTGYIVIPEDSNDRVAKFYFTGVDYGGLTGKKITGGEMFVVDTVKPPAPVSIEAGINDDNIAVEWFYNGEEVNYFNIYRSAVPGVEYVDYYDKGTGDEFTDSDVDSGKSYYYRVAAVDKAGNIGELSSEVHVMFEKAEEEGDKEAAASKEKLSSSLEIELNATAGNVQTILFDIDFAISELERETDRSKNLVIKELRLIDNAKAARSNLENILKEIDTIRQTDLKKDEFDKKLQNIEAKISKIKEDVVTEVIVLDSLEFTQSPTESDTKRVVDEIFLKQDIRKELEDNFTKAAYSLQDPATIFQRIIIAKLESLSSKEGYVTLVSKEVSTPSDAFDVILVETIPKTFSQKASGIVFSENPRVLNEDPVVYWTHPKLQTTKFSYYIKEKRQMSDVKEVKTLILPDPSKFGAKRGVYSNDTYDDNKLTGNLIRDSKKPIVLKEYFFLVIGILIISGLLIYYFFFLKYPPEEAALQDTGGKAGEGKITGRQFSIITNARTPSASEKPQEYEAYRHLLNLIEHASLNADNLNFEQARKEYALIYALFKSGGFQKRQAVKASLLNNINILYNKISVKQKIDDAFSKASRRDKEGLSTIIAELRSTLHVLSNSDGSKTPLSDYIDEYYGYYSNILANMGAGNEKK